MKNKDQHNNKLTTTHNGDGRVIVTVTEVPLGGVDTVIVLETEG